MKGTEVIDLRNQISIMATAVTLSTVANYDCTDTDRGGTAMSNAKGLHLKPHFV